MDWLGKMTTGVLIIFFYGIATLSEVIINIHKKKTRKNTVYLECFGLLSQNSTVFILGPICYSLCLQKT